MNRVQGLFPAQLINFQKGNELKEPIFWFIDGLFGYRTNLVLYYDTGCWRTLSIHFAMKSYFQHPGGNGRSYAFRSTIYQTQGLPQGKYGREITRQEWDDLGFSVENHHPPIGGTIPPNCERVIEMLRKRGILVEAENRDMMAIHQRIIQAFHAQESKSPSSQRGIKMYETQLDVERLKIWNSFITSNTYHNPFSQRHLNATYFQTIEHHDFDPRQLVQIGAELRQWTPLVIGKINVPA